MDELFYIASIKHTARDHEHITFWGPGQCGYTMVIGDHIGRYGIDEARRLNDGYDTLAVPVGVVEAWLSPEPYYLAGTSTNVLRWYDQRGPVVDNTLRNWRRLVDSALDGRKLEVKPAHCTRKRRSFSLADLQASIARVAA